MRTVIVGGPRTGKTTRAREMVNPIHLDALIASHEWRQQSEIAAEFFDCPGPWTIEGCSAVRALRKWLASRPSGKPCDQVIYLLGGAPEAKHARMTGQVASIWAEIEGALLARDVIVSRQVDFL